MRHIGIVLRSRSAYRHTFTILDDQLGKIESFGAYGLTVPHGSLLEYTIQKKGIRCFLQDVQVKEIPLTWARENFLFFHHVLELCDVFLPWDSHCDEVFSLVYQMWMSPEKLTDPKSQKLFLYSFFLKVGVHPEEGEYTMEQWLGACINQHPETLRTAGFVNELLA